MVDKVYVGKSPIHGMGLFAKESIKKGEIIGSFNYKPTKKDGPYVLWMTEEQGCKVEGPLKYINHCNKPNACYFDDLTVVALRNIKPGDEITHYYGEDW